MLFLCFDFGKKENRRAAVADGGPVGTIIARKKRPPGKGQGGR